MPRPPAGEEEGMSAGLRSPRLQTGAGHTWSRKTLKGDSLFQGSLLQGKVGPWAAQTAGWEACSWVPTTCSGPVLPFILPQGPTHAAALSLLQCVLGSCPGC